MYHPYTIALDGGKYMVANDNGVMTFWRHNEPWPSADLQGNGLVLAMAQRIEELEVAIADVLYGSVIFENARNDDGMKDFRDSAWSIPLDKWKTTLDNALEQKS